MRHAVRRPTPAPLPPAPLSHVAALDGVRGLAVGAVLAFHAGHLSGGFLGVDLFFTLSGFLITRLILDELARDTFSLKAFWARRARRLLPAAWLLVGAVLLAGPVLVRTTELGTLRGDAIATLGYGANWWRVATSSSYFEIFTTPSPLQHTWSLAIEEQLYVVWPLLLLLAWRVGRGRIAAVAAVAGSFAVASVIAGALLYSAADDGNRAYYGTETRAASVLIGALAAMAVWRFGPTLARRRGLEPLAVVALAGIVLAWAVGDNGAWLYRGGFASLAIAATFVLAAVTTQPEGRLSRALSWRPLVAVGVISYGVYLYHWPIFVWLSPERTGWSEWPLLVLRLAATFSAATLSYFLVERPYRRRQWSLSLRSAGAVAAFGLIVVAAVTLPAPKRLSGEEAAAAVAAVTVPPASTSTTLAPLPAPKHLVVFGDSVAFKLKQGFADQAPAGVKVDDLGVIACGLGDEWPRLRVGENESKDPCTDWRTKWPAQAKGVGADGTLLVFGSESSTRFVEGEWREACDPVYDAWHTRVFTDAMRTMSQFGPVWVALTPYNRFVVDRDGVLEDRDRHADCTNATYRAAAAAAGPNVRIVDLHGFVCPTGNQCLDEINGVKLRPDGLHFDGPGGDIAARWLLTQLGIP